MKKVGVYLLCFVLILSLTFVIADTSNTTNTTLPALQQNLSKLDTAYTCLQNKIGKCSSLSTSNIALTILAVPSDSVISECQTALTSRMNANGCFPSSSTGTCTIKDTALAILALSSIGVNTDLSQGWLISHNMTSTDLIWYLEQDSNDATTCTLSYKSNDYKVNIGADKKIDSSAGPCLSLAQSDFWLQIYNSCYNTQFQVSCDKDFIATLLYRQENSQTIFVLSDTPSKPAYGTVDLNIKAKCFSNSGSCDYEGSVWATLALLKTGHDVSDFIPYILASGDSNDQYLPNSFAYMITSYQDYATKLIQQQQVGNYWLADSSAHDQYYDTALAVIALKSSSSPQVVNAQNWLLFSQPSSGCWSDSITDTAMVLWALTTRVPDGNRTTQQYCTSSNYFCVPTAECSSSDQLPNYFCPGLSNKCCKTSNLKNCADYSGKICPSGQSCTGNSRSALDTTSCCLAECQVTPSASECDNQGYICQSSCSSNQEQISYSCSTGVCCRTKTTTSSSNFWIWFLIILIIVIIGVILFLMRDRLRLWWFKMRNTKSEKPSMPPSKPGFPPMTRPMQRPTVPMRPAPQQPRQIPSVKRKDLLDDTFKKLKEMSK